MEIMHIINILASRSCVLCCVLFSCLWLSSCASVDSPSRGTAGPNSGPVTPGQEQAEMIATDLVSAMMQLSEFPPWATTIQLSDSTSEFGQALRKTLKASGYGVQNVDSDIGNNNLTSKRALNGSGDNQRVRYNVTIRDITLAREFEVDENRIWPKTPIYITGTSPQRITPNDDLFRQQGRAGAQAVMFPSGVEFFDKNGTVVEYQKRYVRVTPESERSFEDSISHQRILIAARSRALFTSKVNNSVDVRNWPAYKQVLLQFPSENTSILGAFNKTAIKKLLQEFDASLHGLSLTGCASNKSLLWDGTELDSLDRQRRVFDELLVSGIPLERVRENGCFGSEFSNELPKNSVILTLRVRVEET